MKPDRRSSIKATIRDDVDRAFSIPCTDDPLLGPTLGYLYRAAGNLLQSHGTLIQDLLPQILRKTPGFAVLAPEGIRISEDADRMAHRDNLQDCLHTELHYNADGAREVRPDILLFRTTSGTLEFLEVKRGQGKLGSSAIRSLLRDLLCLQMLGRSWGRRHHLHVTEVRARVISIYGQTGLPQELTIQGNSLDEYFGFPMSSEFDEALNFSRDEVERRLPGILAGHRSDQLNTGSNPDF